MEQNKQILLIVSISSLLLSFSAEAICVPKNTTIQIHSHSPAQRPSTQSPQHVSALHRRPSAKSPPHVPALPRRPSAKSPPHVSALPRRPSTKSPPHVSALPRLPSTQSPPHVYQSPPHASSLPRLPAAAHPIATLFNPAMNAICEKTDYPSLCISSLAPFLANRDKPAEILEMAIQAAVNDTGAALAKAMRLSSDPSTPAITKAYIADCLELYTDAIDNFNAAAHAIPSCDIGLMNSMLSAAISDFETCEDGFAEASEESPFKEMDSKLSHMASNCLAIAALLP